MIRGRFFSKPVTSLTYRRALVRYIDANPVQASLVQHASDYRYGSAAQYAHNAGPCWLERSWVEAEILAATLAHDASKEDYDRAFPPLGAGPVTRLIERRIARGHGDDSLDSLVGSAPPQIRLWMERKARLADGLAIGQPLCDSDTLSLILENGRKRSSKWTSCARPRLSDLWKVAETALLRDLAALTWTEIASLCACSSATSHGRYQSHIELLDKDADYAERLSTLAASAVELWR